MTVICGSAGAVRMMLRGHIENRVAAVLAGHSRNHLPDLYDLAGSRTNRRQDARRVRFQFSEAYSVVRRLQLRFGCVNLRFSGIQGSGRLIVVRSRRPTIPEQTILTVEVVPGLGQLRLSGRHIRLRRAQCVQFVLRLQTGNDLTRLHARPERGSILDQTT